MNLNCNVDVETEDAICTTDEVIATQGTMPWKEKLVSTLAKVSATNKKIIESFKSVES